MLETTVECTAKPVAKESPCAALARVSTCRSPSRVLLQQDEPPSIRDQHCFASKKRGRGTGGPAPALASGPARCGAARRRRRLQRRHRRDLYSARSWRAAAALFDG